MAAVEHDAAAFQAALDSGARTLPLPTTLTVESEPLRLSALLRIVPGKRAVLRGEWRGQPVLVKLFTTVGQRQAERERQGYQLLQEAGVATPELLAASAETAHSLLLFVWLPAAEPLLDMTTAPDPQRLAQLLDLVGDLYRAGLYQSDLHGGNFLLSEARAWCIDTGSIAAGGAGPLDAAVIIDNLALLIAQFPLREQSAAHQLVLAHDVTADLTDVQREALSKAVRRRWRVRRDQYLGKCFRDTTAIAFAKRNDRVYACRRDRLGPDLEAFFADPDAAMRDGEMLKDGNSATVVKRVLDGQPVVIKRYNIKSAMHWLRRFWRQSRAWVSWRNAHHLQLLGLHTPAPVAFLERRIGPLRGGAYYISDFVPGEELLELFTRRDPLPSELQGLQDYFRLAAAEQLIHGDLKATNLFAAEGRIWMLDLDAMRMVADKARWRGLFEKDLARFKRNWTEERRHFLNRLGI